MNRVLLAIAAFGLVSSVCIIVVNSRLERLELRVTRLETLNPSPAVGSHGSDLPPFELVCKTPLKSGIVTDDEKLKHGCFYRFPVLHIDSSTRKP